MAKNLEGKNCPKFKADATSDQIVSNETYKNKNVVIGFGITEKTIASLRRADGLVVGSALCKEISNSIKKRQNPVTNVTNIVLKLRKKIAWIGLKKL